MNISDYISSGILEAYVLGQCTPAEQQEVELYALEYPEIKVEIEVIRETLNRYALADEKAPTPQLKAKIAAAVKQAAPPAEKKETKVISIAPDKTPNVRLYRLLLAACFAALVISGIISLRLYSKLDETREEATQLNAQKDTLVNEMKAQKESYTAMQKTMEQWQQDMALLKRPNMVTMELTGLKPAPDAKAMVYMDTKTSEVYLEVNRLPKAPEGMQYQFWAIVKGKPVSAGMIDLCEQSRPDNYGDCGIHKMTTMPDAHAFAISLEKKGGSSDGPKGDIYAACGI